ncbi:hypothetical protein BCR35DRAFT_307602 [Leucosporidium creatinivorum]|uniref:Uncharacterized protein n=1 Tax=Leucosporidium creatinivorum TaxID=106004 RepID=A0A1Y2EMP3_9BASI|nr:hypothetical protein BCR35DRAFT_307602 [Leucosporidium creatinivorum]
MQALAFLFILSLLFSCFTVVARAQTPPGDAQQVLTTMEDQLKEHEAQIRAQEKQQAKQAESFGEREGEGMGKAQCGKKEGEGAKQSKKGKGKKSPFAGIRIPDHTFELKTTLKRDAEGHLVVPPLDEWVLVGLPGDEMSIPCCSDGGCEEEEEKEV